MAYPSIVFDDGSGATTITSLVPRFQNWIPDTTPIGPNETALGTGQTFQWAYRTDYSATFDMGVIPPASLPDLQRLKVWLLTGGTITINTADLSAHSYTVTLKPGSIPSWKLDQKLLEYTLSLGVLNSAAAPLTCQYR